MSANLPHETRPVIDFRDPAQRQAWTSVDDRVMGGVSASPVTVTAEGLVFSGEVSLANNGGFALIRARLSEYDLAGGFGATASPTSSRSAPTRPSMVSSIRRGSRPRAGSGSTWGCR